MSNEMNVSSEMEERLRRLKPQIGSTESEVLYRCGWEAALIEYKQADLAGRRRRDWNRYLSGAISGLAASLAIAFFWPQQLSDESQTIKETSVIASNHEPIPRLVDADPIDEANRNALVDVATERRPLSIASANLAPFSLLSPIARKNWSSVLAEDSRINVYSDGDSQPFLNRESLQSLLRSTSGS
jgi:hypothetical protein